MKVGEASDRLGATWDQADQGFSFEEVSACLPFLLVTTSMLTELSGGSTLRYDSVLVKRRRLKKSCT